MDSTSSHGSKPVLVPASEACRPAPRQASSCVGAAASAALQAVTPSKLGCNSLEEIPAEAVSQVYLDSLPATTVIVQLTEGVAEGERVMQS